MTGPELKQLREHLRGPRAEAHRGRHGEALRIAGEGRRRHHPALGSHRPEPPGKRAARVLAMASERYPILEKFDVFDRHDVREEDRPARAAFREQMRDEVRRRLG